MNAPYKLGSDNTAVIFTNDSGRGTWLVAFFAIGPITVRLRTKRAAGGKPGAGLVVLVGQ